MRTVIVAFALLLSVDVMVAQNLSVSVLLGNTPVEYAFIFKNGNCLGNCDSLGRFDFPIESIECGDSLKASVAGLSSEVVVYDGKTRCMTLNIKVGELVGARVVEKNLRRIDEYVSLVRSVPFKWRVFGRRFHCEYEMTYNHPDVGNDSRASRGISDFTILNNYDGKYSKNKTNVPIYSLDNNYDNKDIIMVGFDLFNSYVILGKILNRHSERLKDECVSGRMLIHKLSGDVGMSYLLVDKSGDNSQILVRFDEHDNILDVCLEGSRNEEYGLEHYVWRIATEQTRKDPVRISGIELHGRMIFTGKNKDVVIKEIQNSPLTLKDMKMISAEFSNTEP